MRTGLTITRDSVSSMNLTVELDREMLGVVVDESPANLSRGGFAAWSARCRNRSGIVGFYPSKEEAAEAIADLFAEAGPGGSKAPQSAEQRAVFLALPTDRRNDVARAAARLYDGTSTVAACWTAVLADDGADHPGPDPETGEQVYVRTHSATTRHLPNLARPGRRTLCGQEWVLPSWYQHNGEIRRLAGWMLRDLPDCGGCIRSNAAQKARRRQAATLPGRRTCTATTDFVSIPIPARLPESGERGRPAPDLASSD